VEKKETEADKKVNEFLEKFNALQDEYKEFCVLTLVNKVDKN
jgi:hypothetical protein